jgi:hypothetical protein
VKNQCDGHQSSCDVSANNGIFGDPCPNTYKYLKIGYECQPMNIGKQRQSDSLSIVDAPFKGGITLRPLSFRTRSFRPFIHFVPGHLVPG